MGVIVAERLTNPGLVSYLQLPDEYRVAEIQAPPNLAGKTVEDINPRDKYNLSLITIKRAQKVLIEEETAEEHHITGVPISSTIINADDFLIVFGKDKDIQRFIEINQ